MLQLAIARCPAEAVLHFNLATVFEDLRRDAAAITHYEQALGIDPAEARDISRTPLPDLHSR